MSVPAQRRRSSSGSSVRRVLRPSVSMALLVLFLSVSGLPAAEVDLPDAAIVEVTVFPDRAAITRSATVSLPAGRSVVRLMNLPWKMETNSLHVSAQGPPATLGAIDVETEAEKPVETKELQAARDEVRRIKTEMAALDGKEQTAAQMEAFLMALRATTGTRESEKLGEGKIDVEAVSSIYTFIHERLDELGAEKLKREARRKDRGRDLKVAQARLAAARPSGSIKRRTVAVEIDLASAGRLTLRLQYVTAGASWKPSYRIGLNPSSGEVGLLSQAVVKQKTGADWHDVILHLSTASPARGVKPPELPPVFLRAALRIAARRRRSALLENDVVDRMNATSGKIANSPAMKSKGVSARAVRGKEDEDVEGAAAVLVPSGNETAELEDERTSRVSPILTFHVAGPSTVPADGRDHRVTLQEARLASKLEYLAVPSRNTSAFLVAEVTAPSGYPLLAGPARVFLGAAYLGSFPLQETGPGARLKLPFGPDHRLEIHRFPVTTRKKDSLSGRDHRESHGFRTTVANHRKTRVSVVVEERIPVSRDERIQVEMGRKTTPGWEEVEDRPGVFHWKLDLAPGQQGEVSLEYSIRYPANLLLSRSPHAG
ncbi:MAG: mucoidy inhibitor MuiA family protein [Acidobacteriota bacterium]